MVSPVLLVGTVFLEPLVGMVSLGFLVETDVLGPLGFLVEEDLLEGPLDQPEYGEYLDHRGRLVEGPCTSGGGRAPVHKSKVPR